MRERTCQGGCGGVVTGRRARCDDCRARHRAAGQLERDRAARARGGQADGSYESFNEADVIDMTQGGASRPSHEPDVPPRPARRPVAEPEVVDYTQGGYQRTSIYERRTLAGVPGAVRRDFVRAQRAAAQNEVQDDDSTMSTWASLQAAVSEPYDGPEYGSVALRPPGSAKFAAATRSR
jgi:hypothetical protein